MATLCCGYTTHMLARNPKSHSVLKADHQVFGHVVVEQPIDPGSHSASKLPGALVGSDFALTLGTLVQVRCWCVGGLPNA